MSAAGMQEAAYKTCPKRFIGQYRNRSGSGCCRFRALRAARPRCNLNA